MKNLKIIIRLVLAFFVVVFAFKGIQIGLDYLKTGELTGSGFVQTASAATFHPREFPSGTLKEQSFVRNKFRLRHWQRRSHINAYRSLPLLRKSKYWVTRNYRKLWKQELDGEGKWILRMPPRFFK